jgi:hypothetical protein
VAGVHKTPAGPGVTRLAAIRKIFFAKLLQRPKRALHWRKFCKNLT